MGIFDRFKKTAKPAPKKESKKTRVKSEKKEKKQAAPRPETEIKEAPIKKLTELKKSQNIDPGKILFKPIISEKATDLNARGQYVFEVAPSASKSEIAKAIVNLPDKVEVIEETTEQGTTLRLQVADEDKGRIIGKQGRVAEAIRTLLRVKAAKAGTRVNLEIV